MEEIEHNSSVFENLEYFLSKNASANSTKRSFDPGDFDVPISQQVFFILIGLVIVAINLCVVTTSGLIMKKGMEPLCTYLLLGNLAMTDMIIGLVGVIVAIFFKQLANLSRFGCAIQMAIYNSTMIVSGFTVALIAFDRFLYILHGIKYNQLVYPKRVRLVIALTWIIGLFIGLLPGFGWSNEWVDGQLCLYIDFIPKTLIATIAIIVTIPIPIILVLYGIILIKALKKIKQIGKETTLKTIGRTNSSKMRIFRGSTVINTVSSTINDNSVSVAGNSSVNSPSANDNAQRFGRPMSKNSKKWKAFMIVMLTSGGYVVTWVPGCIVSVTLTYCDSEATPDKCDTIRTLSAFSSVLSFMNCFLNPIIYAWWHRGFRKAALRIYYRKQQCFLEWWERFQ